MKELEGRQITYVKLHGTDAFIPGLGGLGSTLPPTSKALNLTMIHTHVGVHLSVAGTRGIIEALIPWSNVQLVSYGSNNASAVQSKPAKKSVEAVA